MRHKKWTRQAAKTEICSKYRKFGLAWDLLKYPHWDGFNCSFYKQLLNSSPGRRIFLPGRGCFLPLMSSRIWTGSPGPSRLQVLSVNPANHPAPARRQPSQFVGSVLNSTERGCPHPQHAKLEAGCQPSVGCSLCVPLVCVLRLGEGRRFHGLAVSRLLRLGQPRSEDLQIRTLPICLRPRRRTGRLRFQDVKTDTSHPCRRHGQPLRRTQTD
jgi:hypothetical protein